VRELRKCRGITQAEFGRLIGKSLPTVQRYETAGVPYNPTLLLGLMGLAEESNRGDLIEIFADGLELDIPGARILDYLRGGRKIPKATIVRADHHGSGLTSMEEMVLRFLRECDSSDFRYDVVMRAVRSWVNEQSGGARGFAAVIGKSLKAHAGKSRADTVRHRRGRGKTAPPDK